MFRSRNPQPGRAWATTGFVAGTACSIAANVAHASAPVARESHLGAQLMSAFYPVALLISVEVQARVRWPATWPSKLARYGGLLLVSICAAVISYNHMSGLLRFYGESKLLSGIGPLVVDGLMLVCGYALLATRRAQMTGETGALLPQDAPAPGSNAPDALVETDAPESIPLPPDLVLLPGGGSTGAPREHTAPESTTGASGEGVLSDPEIIARACSRYESTLASGQLPSKRQIKADLGVGAARAARVHQALADRRPSTPGRPLP